MCACVCDGNSVLWYTNALLMFAASPYLVINAVVVTACWWLYAVYYGEQCNRMSFCPTVASAGASTPLQASTESRQTGDMSRMAIGEFMHALWCV